MKCQNIYTNIGCNSSCGCVDWSSSGLLAYGASNSIVVIDLATFDQAQSGRTYVKHSAQVRTIKWIENNHALQQNEIISGGDDCRAILWNLIDSDESRVLTGHTGSVTSIGFLKYDRILLIATGSSDHSIKLWEVTTQELDNFQDISLAPGCCFAIRFAMISGLALMAFSTTDCSIDIYAEAVGTRRNFSPLLKLLGHQNWVRGLDFVAFNNAYYLGSCSQDKKIRIWKFSTSITAHDQGNTQYVRVNYSGDMESCTNTLKRNLLNVTLESILSGHDDWVFDIHWGQCEEGLQLLSCSIDKTIIIWSVNEKGFWCLNTQVGMVGENSTGFYGGKFSNDGHSILGYGFNGSLYLWNKKNKWESELLVKGHSAAVNGISWELGGHKLFSTSTDQTTLLHSDCGNNSLVPNWKVISCPQKHGFGIKCIAALNCNLFATGADEKVIRVFQEPLEGTTKNSGRHNVDSNQETFKVTSHPLNLSNKVIRPKHPLTPLARNENSVKSEVWPEIQKLYGHTHEIFALTCTADGKILASSCKAYSAKDSQIILWSTCTWKIIKKIDVHHLTVTSLQFSHNCQFLLAVSKDRKWSLFRKSIESNDIDFNLVLVEKNVIHKRVIWCCCWSHDDNYFATSSRDGKVVLWGVQPKVKPRISDVIEVKGESITACAFACKYFDCQTYLIAAGMASGIIKLYLFNCRVLELLSLTQSESHHLSVQQLEFRPSIDAFQMASCGDDHIVRIYEFAQ